MSDAPPPKMRPTWNAVTIVEPNANALGSTSVACWLCGLVKVSVLSWVSAISGVGGGVTAGEEWLEPPHAARSKTEKTRSSAVKTRLGLLMQKSKSVALRETTRTEVCDIGDHAIRRFMIGRASDLRILRRLLKYCNSQM